MVAEGRGLRRSKSVHSRASIHKLVHFRVLFRGQGVIVSGKQKAGLPHQAGGLLCTVKILFFDEPFEDNLARSEQRIETDIVEV